MREAQELTVSEVYEEDEDGTPFDVVVRVLLSLGCWWVVITVAWLALR